MGERVVQFLSSEGAVVGGLAVVVALAVAWYLRGAPPGQRAEPEPVDSPGTGRRDGLVVAVIAGLLAVLLGAYLGFRAGVAYAAPAFAGGFGLLYLATSAARKYRHESPSLRRLWWFGETALTGSLLTGVLVIGNVLAFRYGARPVDLSSDGAYSLESLTTRQLRSLDRPAKFVVLSGSSARAMGQQERVRQLLRLFEAENPELVSVEYLDPFADPARLKELRGRIGEVPLDEGGCVVVEIGEGDAARHGFVRNYDMFKLEADESGRPDRVRTRFLGEGELTGALIRLTQGERPRVGFSTGHGEPSIMQMNPAAPGFGVARSLLEKLGMQVAEVNLARPIPAELSTLVIAAPMQSLGADDLARIEKYMAGGGRLVVVLDGSVPSGLETWLKERGMELAAGVVVDPTLNFRRPVYPLVEIGEGDKSDPIVGPLVGKMILVPQPSPLKLDPSKAPSGRPRILLRTSPSSWAESEPAATRLSLDPRADTPGPIAVAATLADPPTRGTDRRPTPRAVVFSSRTLFDNETIAAAPTNFELLANALAWLERRQDLAGVPPRTYVARTLSAAPSLRAKLVLLPTLLSGAVIIGLGVATYIARRD